MASSAFRLEHPLERRQAEANRIREKYPDRIPVIVEKAERSDIPDIDKKKSVLTHFRNNSTAFLFLTVPCSRRYHCWAVCLCRTEAYQAQCGEGNLHLRKEHPSTDSCSDVCNLRGKQG
ncbi:uncharacterized protein LOC133899612 isoform X2 [Phragmites australis]|uniref:uncharacterized protein LOC133899612 isoform X2 n=1 Tax=Phragmites australis TaxID=29695 RepID=UPI002D78BC7B|nr:uncharacterized protein LOC133899612 isoform X2 [Phragmites australis]